MKAKQLGKYIVADPEICHGKLTFKGTRIFVKDILEMVAEGISQDRIVEKWRGSITKEAISEAVMLASEHLITEFSDDEITQEMTGNQVSKKTSGGIDLPSDLQARLADDAAKIPNCTESELGRSLIDFAYRMIEQFGLTPKEVSDDIHYTESRRLVQPPSLQYGYDLAEFRRANNYDLITAIKQSSAGGLRTTRSFGYYDHFADEGELKGEGEVKRRA
ncbi:MAG TPA: DUF433 domain-containing protein [Blastocatellia bacterium]|nr:DUF433 domain-containing protein [Blastocatellia bacterium]